jgi:circadian clock protein KaiB
VRRIIGDLSDRERVLIGLDLLYEELSDETYGFEEEGNDLSDGPQDPEPISSDGSGVGGGGDSPHL